MSETNFSTKLFSYRGQAPDFLPDRLRLPDGQTRRPSCITLEEIGLCGYTGPLEIPETDDQHVVIWDSENFKFSLKQIENVYENDLLLIDRAVRKLLESLKINLKTVENSSPEYIHRFYLYLGSIERALSSNNLLNYTDIPEPINCYFCSEDDKQESFYRWAYIENNIEVVKYVYETKGILDLPIAYSGCLVVPDDWVYTPTTFNYDSSIYVDTDEKCYTTCSGLVKSSSYGEYVVSSGYCLHNGSVSYDLTKNLTFEPF